MEEEIVTQIGLLLSQLRYARRALEDIERSTAHYGGVTFAVALAAGPFQHIGILSLEFHVDKLSRPLL